jgi:hypothetical protein
MPKNAKKTVYREKEFGIYMLWKSLPPHARGMTKKELTKLGYTDPIVATIIKIKSQSEFARVFGIKDLGTLTDWNNKIARGLSSSPTVNRTLAPRHAEIKEKILLPKIKELSAKIQSQKKELAELRKNNALLRRKNSTNSPKRAHRPSKAESINETTPESNPAQTIHALEEKSQSFATRLLKSARRFLKRDKAE